MPEETHKTASHLFLSDEEFRGETIYFAVTDRFNVGKKHVHKGTDLDDSTHPLPTK
jgi:hypothetical protein